jgi:drug/metabolite transporter (DMT)-like permease
MCRAMETKTQGWINGFVGVLIFSGSLPATRMADAGFTPVFLTGARAVIAGALGLALLLVFRAKLPARKDVLALLIVASGVAVGFPLLTALALTHLTTARSILYIGLLPLSTAMFAVLRGGERPHPAFWIFSLLGSALIAGYALAHGVGGASVGDLLMLAAIVICGLAYAEGAKLSRTLGGWQVISWALVLSLPLMAGLMFESWPGGLGQVAGRAWIGLGYVSVFSSLIGFLFWYRGLAQGGIATVGQLQLLQPGFGLILAATLLHETIDWPLMVVMAAVASCVVAAKRYS